LKLTGQLLRRDWPERLRTWDPEQVRSPFGAPVQVAYPVTDVRTAAHRWVELTGAGPFFVVDHIGLSAARVDGVEAPFDHSSAYGQWGAVMVELVAEHTPPLVPLGSGIHHMAFMVDDLPAAMRWCTEAGWSERLWARTSSGVEFAFMYGATFGHLAELYEPSAPLLGFYAMVAAAADGWDGRDPVRAIG